MHIIFARTLVIVHISTTDYLGTYGLARVAVVDENLETLYHTYVKPDVEIADYVTRYSGITEELLRDVKKTPSDVQHDLRDLLPSDAILVGQSLQSDLKALKVRFFFSFKH